jgi:hypothetical protein
MNGLLTYLVGELPGNCRVQDWQLQFRGNDWLPWWAAVLIAVAVFGFVLVLYFLESSRVSLPRRILGAVLRTAAVVFLLLLLLRPILVAEMHCERPREVVVLIDNSQSMRLRDQRLSPTDRLRVALAQDRFAPDIELSKVPPEVLSAGIEDRSRGDLVRDVLAHPRLKILERLGEHGPLRAVLFGGQPHAVTDESGSRELRGADAATLQKRLLAVLPSPPPPGNKEADDSKSGFPETQTALADAVAALLQPRHGEGLPAAIVVITDGRDNASKTSLADAARDCAAAGVPLHIYGVGSSESGNLQMKELAVSDTLFSEDTASVAVRWRSQGFTQGRADIVLTLDGKVVATKEVAAREGDDFREVLTFVTPRFDAEKRSDLVATIQYRGQAQEPYAGDNSAARPIRVVDRKVRVLYVEGQPRWEYKFLMQNLLRDRRVQVRVLPIYGDATALKSGAPYVPAFPTTREELFQFDLLILGDVPAAYFTSAQMEWIRDFVQEGGGLVALAGPQAAPTTWHGKPLAEVLPVEFTPDPKPRPDPNARTVAFKPVLTAEGKRRDMLALADTPEESLKVWQELPGFYWYYPVTKLKPGADALLEHPTAKANNKPVPLIAWHFFGKGRVLFLGVDEIWRWRFNSGEKYIARFWGQVVYQMGMPHLVGNPKRVQLALEKAEATLGQSMEVFARVLDGEYRPLTAPTVPAKLEQIDEKTGRVVSRPLMLERVESQPGEYRTRLDNAVEGRFVIKVEAPETVALEYRVARAERDELAVAGMAEDALRRLAEASGGKFYREEDLHRLAAEVKPQTVESEHHHEVLVWQAWWVLLLFLGIVTAEWLLRKFSNLS